MKRTSHLLKTVGVTVVALFLTLAFAQNHPLDLENASNPQAYQTAWSGASVEDVEAWLESGGDVNAKDMSGRTVLIWAILLGNDSDIIGTLIDAGADVNIRDKHSLTALNYAAPKGNISIIRSLLEAGADVNAQDQWGGTPLLSATVPVLFENIDSSVITLLLNAGADVNIRNSRNELALIGTVYHVDIFRAIVEAGLDIDARYAFGKTALINAVLMNAQEAVIVLLDAGANASLKDNNGKAALDYAAEIDTFEGTEAYQRLLWATR